MGSGRYIVGDWRFGSVKCAYSLRKDMGLFSIMNVKRNTKRFIKNEILEQLQARGDQVSYKVTLEDG